MKINPFSQSVVVLSIACMFVLAGNPVRAQEEEKEEYPLHNWGKVYVEIEAWEAQPAGLEFDPATAGDPSNPFATSLRSYSYDTATAARYRAGFAFPKNYGALVGTWYAQGQDMAIGENSPGDFVFGILLTNPLYAGFANDGLADGYNSTAEVVLRDLRIDYYRKAFSNDRFSANWFIGWRRVQFKRDMSAQYHALGAPLPPLIPPYVSSPRNDLIPLSDLASIGSHWEGRGISAGMDFLMPFVQNKLSVEAGFDLAALRGKTDTSYQSATAYYALMDGNSEQILSSPYDAFNDPELIGGIEQRMSTVALQAQSRSTTSGILEGYVGLRWHAWKGLSAAIGFRGTYYDNVGVDLRPKTVVTEAGLNLQDVTETDRSVTYEGFYLALAYAF